MSNGHHLVIPTLPLRLIEAVAAAAAKEDLMYHLQRALSEGKIDCQTFLKVRGMLPKHTTSVCKTWFVRLYDSRHANSFLIKRL